MASQATYRADNVTTPRGRADPRISVRLRGFMIDQDRRAEPVKITNIARLGFLAEGAAPRETGDVVTLSIEQFGNHEARIVWSAGGKVGGRFTNPIEDSCLESL